MARVCKTGKKKETEKGTLKFREGPPCVFQMSIPAYSREKVPRARERRPKKD